RGDTSARQIEAALEEVMAGGSPMTPGVARKVICYFQGMGDSREVQQLTPREREVLTCLAQGWIYKEIAARLGITMNTARTHLRNIYRKLQTRSRTEAVVKYLRGRSK